jgi:ABC-2 type transport system permease protein
MKSFYVCAIIAAAMAAISMFLDSQLNNMMQSMSDTMGDMMTSQMVTLKNILPTIISPTGDYFILVIIGVCLFITIEYNAGTLKNIAARGFKREYIFLSKIIVCIVEAFIITLCFAVSCVIFGLIFLGTPAGGFGDGYFTELFTIYGVDILILIGYVSFIAMIAYLIRTNGGTIAITLCAHYLVPVIITMFNVVTIMNDTSDSDLEKMMSYTSNQYGQAAYYWIGTLGGAVSESYHNGTIYIPILVALAYIVVSCAIGMLVFKKRDIK